MDQHPTQKRLGFVPVPQCREAWILRSIRDRLVVQVTPPGNVLCMSARVINDFVDWASINSSKETVAYRTANAALEEHMRTCLVCQENTRLAIEIAEGGIVEEYKNGE